MTQVVSRARKLRAVAKSVAVLCFACGLAGQAVATAGQSAPTEPGRGIAISRSGQVAPAPVLPPPPSPPVGPQSQPATEMLARVQQSVFSLTVKVGPGIGRTGTAFLVDGSGLAVTNYHVIEGASEAQAIVAGMKAPIPVQLVAAKPAFDLALVRIPISDPALKAASLQPLPILSPTPALGTEVWAIGFPSGLGLTVTRGVIGGLRAFGQLPAEMRDILRNYDSASQWLQTDCTLNHGNSGGPLVDPSGGVVGIATWVWPDATNTNFALGARHLADFIAEPRSQTVSFADLKATSRTAAGPRATFPWLDIKQDAPYSEVARAAKTFESQAACQTCKGTGVVTRQVVTGRTSNGNMSKPTTGVEAQTCPTCGGQYYARTDVLWNGGARFVSRIARTSLEQVGAARPASLIGKSLQAVLWANPVVLAERLNDRAVTLLTGATASPGEPILCVGTVTKDLSSKSGTVRTIVVALQNKHLFVIVVDPRLIDATERETVLVGGLLSGRLDGPDGQLVPVLQGGFVQALKGKSEAPP